MDAMFIKKKIFFVFCNYEVLEVEFFFTKKEREKKNALCEDRDCPSST